MARFSKIVWDLADEKGHIGTWERVGIAVLMDIRDELQKLNGLLGCPNFTSVPSLLRAISDNTKQKRKQKRRRKP